MADGKRCALAVIGLWAYRAWIVGLGVIGILTIPALVAGESLRMLAVWLWLGLVLQLLRRTLKPTST